MLQAIITTLPMMVCAILSGLLGLSLLRKWDRPRFNLLLFMVAATCLYWGHGVFFYHQTELIPFSDSLYCFCNPAVFPLFLLYIEELTLRQPNRRWHIACLLPSVICFTTVAMLYTMMNQEETADFIEHHLYNNETFKLTGLAWWQGIVHIAVRIVFALEIPLVLYIGWRHISKYNQTIENYYSNTEGKLLSHLKVILFLFAITSLLSFVFNAIGRHFFTHSLWLLAVPSVLFSTILILIGHIGLHQQFHIQDIKSEEENELGLATPQLINENKFSEAIQHLVEEEKLYLQPNLKIDDLAKRLNTNRNYVYQAINVGMGLSFTTYINQKRIEYAKHLIEENPKALLTEISLKSGFTSTSAFYRNFKTFIGCSPSKYQQDLQ
jgi:AraC-like DNA-binding protein